MNHSTRLLSFAALCSLVACADEPPTPAEVRAAIAKDLAHVLTEANGASEGASAAAPSDAAMTMIDRMLGESDSEITARMRAKVGAFMLERKVKSAIASLAAPEDPVAEEDVSAETVRFLNEELFTDANHLGEGVFQVPAELACTTTTIDDTGNTIEMLDEECATRHDAAQIRIRVSKGDDAMRFTLQMTEEKEEPFSVALAPQSIALTIDLDDAWRSAVAAASLAGEDVPNAALSGQVTGKLTILGTAHAEASLAIDRDVSIKLAEAGKDLEGAEALRFTSKKANVFAISADGANQAGTLTLGLASTYVHVPSLFATDGTTVSETFELDLAGLTAHAEFAVGQPTVISDVGIGDRELITKLDGRVASWVAVNPDDGRKFGATIVDDVATGRSTISVTPVLDVRTFVDHAVDGSQPAVYDITRTFLDGTLSSSAADPATVKVESGSYSIETNPAGYGFTATAGQCVTSSESIDSTTGAYYTTFTTGACQ